MTVLSIIDIKKKQLEYWQTGGTFAFSIGVILTEMFLTVRPWLLFAIHIVGAILIFILMLVFSMLGAKGNSFGFGGADIWVATALGLCFGALDIWMVLIISFASYLIYALIYRIVKKSKATHTAFLPFFTVGALYGVVSVFV